MRFVWDPLKEQLNQKKHKVAFKEAVSVFLDPMALRIHDPDHSTSEDRWIMLGLSFSLNLLVVVFVEREEKTIRIISARKANRKERENYVKRSK